MHINDLASVTEATEGTGMAPITAPFIAPSDGYLTVYCEAANSYCITLVYGRNGINQVAILAAAYDSLSRNSIFLRKGMKVYEYSKVGTVTIFFGAIN